MWLEGRIGGVIGAEEDKIGHVRRMALIYCLVGVVQ